MSNIQENWRPVKDYEKFYEVSSQGLVKSIACTISYNRWSKQSKKCLKEKLRAICIDENGYNYITSNKTGTAKKLLIHRLVAIAFIPNPNNLPQVNHKDANKSNNSIDNLEWCTAKQNAEHKVLNNLHVRGVKCHAAKLTDEKALDIYCNLTFKQAIEKYNVSQSVYYGIKAKKQWKHIHLLSIIL